MNVDIDVEDLSRTVNYEYNRITTSIDKDWSGRRLPVAELTKQYLRLTVETLEDQVLMNEAVIIENDGPVLQNCLTTVPPRYGQKMDLQQLMQNRIFKCKFLCLLDIFQSLFIYLF